MPITFFGARLTNRGRMALIAITVVGAFLTGMTANSVIQGILAPSCPTEDSCASNYDGDLHHWIITEVTP